MKNTLKSLALASTLALGLTGCDEPTPKGRTVLSSGNFPYVVYTGKVDRADVAYPTNDLAVTGFGRRAFNVEPKELIGYARFFNEDTMGVMRLINNQIPAKVANSFPERLNTTDIVYLTKIGIKPEQVKPYDSRFGCMNIAYFIGHDVAPERINPFGDTFAGDQRTFPDRIVKISEALTPKQYLEFQELRMLPEDMISMIKSGVDAGMLKSYGADIFPNVVVALKQKGITPKVARKYLDLNKKYGTDIKPWKIAELVESGLPFDEVERMAKDSKIEKILFGKE